MMLVIVGCQLTQTVQNGCTRPISKILHIENWIVCCIETYLIPILQVYYGQLKYVTYTQVVCI